MVQGRWTDGKRRMAARGWEVGRTRAILRGGSIDRSRRGEDASWGIESCCLSRGRERMGDVDFGGKATDADGPMLDGRIEDA